MTTDGSKEQPQVIRGKLNGKELYCRIPIRKKRVAIYADEFRYR